MAVAARWIGLDSDGHGLPHRTQTFDRLCRIGVRRVRVQESVLALDGLGRTAEPLAGEAGRSQSAHGGVADVVALGPGTVEQKLHGPRRLAQADTEAPLDLLAGQTEHVGRGGRRPESTACRRRMEATRVMVARTERQTKSDLYLVTGDDGGEYPGAARAGHFGGGEGRWHDGGARVDGAARMGVVEIKRVGQGSVNQGGAGRCVRACVADHGSIATGQAQLRRRGHERRRRLGLMARPKRDADVVEHQQLDPVRHLRREAVVRQAGGEFGKRSGYGGHRVHFPQTGQGQPGGSCLRVLRGPTESA